MRALLLTLLATATVTPALAQHAGDDPVEPGQLTSEQPNSEDAGHRAAPEPGRPGAADPHAGHDRDAPAPSRELAGQEPHAGHDMPERHGASHMPPSPAGPPSSDGPPPAALDGPRHAADTIFGPAVMQAARRDLRGGHGDFRGWWVMADRFEAGIADESDAYLWDVQGWYGGDFHKLWVKSEGEGTFGERLEQAEVQALWSRAVTPWLDFQAGVRYDFRPDPERAHLAVGLQGLIPYKFEVDAAAFLSDEGDLTARFEAEYDQRITQRLLLQPRIELELAARDIPEIGVGSGLTSAELGLRLRYELVREFAPYLGIDYERAFGETADFLRAAGEDPSDWKAVLGVRMWF